MSFFSNFNVLSILYSNPKSILWVGTMYWKIIKDLSVIAVGEYLMTESCHFEVVDEFFHLELKKTSPEIISLICRKTATADSNPDDGYFFRLYFTMCGISEPSKSAVMLSTDTSISVDYMIHSFVKSPVAAVKCVIRMIETSNLQGVRYDSQERVMQKWAENCTELELRDLAYLLKVPTIFQLYTGRHDKCFTMRRMYLIERVRHHSKELAEFMRALKRIGVTSEGKLPELPLRSILGYIYSGKKRTIKQEECISLYLTSHKMGLEFLQKICMKFMLENLDIDFVPEVLQAADTVEDPDLFKIAMYYLLSNQEILQSEKWNKMTELSMKYVFSVIHSITMRLAVEGLKTPPAQFEETERKSCSIL